MFLVQLNPVTKSYPSSASNQMETEGKTEIHKTRYNFVINEVAKKLFP